MTKPLLYACLFLIYAAETAVLYLMVRFCLLPACRQARDEWRKLRREWREREQ